MKRHPKLQNLSREHHTALQLALRAKRAAASGDRAEMAGAANACIAAFPLELEPHFVVEEETLLPLLAAAGEHALVANVHRDHTELRQLFAQLGESNAETLSRFAAVLTAHVRFEEREVFPALERLFDVEL